MITPQSIRDLQAEGRKATCSPEELEDLLQILLALLWKEGEELRLPIHFSSIARAIKEHAKEYRAHWKIFELEISKKTGPVLRIAE